ncbi:MAG: DUF4416 family protein [Planctomycetota bacterium]
MPADDTLLTMARPRKPTPVKLIVGLLAGDIDLLRRARQLLKRTYGPVDLESDFWPFTQTDYYETEMGPDLTRWFLGFERLIRPDNLAEIKLRTNDLEELMTKQCLLPDRPRPVNLDPGYLNLAQLVLATTKDHAHRLYLGLGIHAEVTLYFKDGQWQTWPWTYPDYREPHYHAFFTQVRERYREQRAQWAERLEPFDEDLA